MVDNFQNALYVDYAQIAEYDLTLAETIEKEYYRYEAPFQ